jgi:hypothetical protein
LESRRFSNWWERNRNSKIILREHKLLPFFILNSHQK